jgi:hypothetical protein
MFSTMGRNNYSFYDELKKTENNRLMLALNMNTSRF